MSIGDNMAGTVTTVTKAYRDVAAATGGHSGHSDRRIVAPTIVPAASLVTAVIVTGLCHFQTTVRRPTAGNRRN
jgi:hypothetical protein